jgi:glycosyltransferase involved in cell wall biosynthesis
MKFSVITAVRNNKEGLLRAIECVRNQTYKNIEHIIVDGGSTDGTVEAIKNEQLKIKNGPLSESPLPKTAGKPKGERVLRFVSEPDDGIYDAINKGIKLATGDVIGMLHSDDLYADENVISRYVEVFEMDSGSSSGMTERIDAVYSDLVYVKEKLKVKPQKSEDHTSIQSYNYSILRYWKTHKTVISNQSSVNSKNTDHLLLVTDHLLKKGWMPPHPTLFIRKKVFEKYGLYNTDLKIASDYEMILRLFYKHKITSHYLPVTTYLMTTGGASNKSIKNILQKSKEDFRAMKLNGINLPFITLLSKNLRKLPQFLARGLP